VFRRLGIPKHWTAISWDAALESVHLSFSLWLASAKGEASAVGRKMLFLKPDSGSSQGLETLCGRSGSPGSGVFG